jgi:ATP-dependent DNA helicase RecQ
MSDLLDRTLRDRFGLEALRPWQREAIDAVLEGSGKALVVAPTGGGKSLVYQLPAVVLGGLTLVVSPLISLMEDQVRALEARGIAATFLASTLDGEEIRDRFRRIRRGDVSLAYVAPERLGETLASLVEDRLELVAIDEAHCVVQWGHDFRPDYLKIREFLDRARPRRVLACTATATPASRAAIVAALGLDPATTSTILRGFARPNLALSVVDVDGPKAGLAHAVAALDRALGSRKKPRGAGIVYAGTRKQTERVAAALVDKGFAAKAYHAGMDGSVRSAVADAFARRELDVVVATNAFGMGIDRPDVRVVVHAQPPGSIEAYYQEVGRAGRDGAPAEAVMTFATADIAMRRRLIELGPDGSRADEATIARQWSLFRDLLRYVDARSCRHDFVLRYFGDEAESLGGCGQCDVCVERREIALDPSKIARDTEVVRKALAGVARASQRGGLTAVAQMLAGVANERIDRFGFRALSTFGLLREHGESGALAALRACIAAGYVGLTPTEHPVPHLTPLGVRVMRAEASSEIVLRDPAAPRSSRLAQKPSKPSRPFGSARSGERSPPPSLGDVSPDESELDPTTSSRLARLRVERARIAKEQSVPAYVVATNRALEALAGAVDCDEGELVELPGWGPRRVTLYGERLLAAASGLPIESDG